MSITACLRRLGALLLGLALTLPTLATEPLRVISIDGSVTEIIYALGQQQTLVAVDSTSRCPQAAQQLPQVGYMRQLAVEGILSLQPDLVLASHDAGPDSVFAQLQAAGVRIVRTPGEYSLDGVLAKIASVASALGVEAAGEQLQLQVREQTQAALARLPDASAGPVPAALFLLGAGNRGLMAAGDGTQAAAMLALAGARNTVAYEGYKPLSPEGALQAAPDVVILAHTGNEPAGVIESSLAMTPAAHQNRIFAVDVSLTLGFGPRLGEALNLLIDRIWYPQQLPYADRHASSRF